jgi:hypothetical protein
MGCSPHMKAEFHSSLRVGFDALGQKYSLRWVWRYGGTNLQAKPNLRTVKSVRFIQP